MILRTATKLILILLLAILTAESHERCISSSDLPLSQKRVILILPGYGSSLRHVNQLARSFQSDSVDVICADVIDRRSLAASVEKLNRLVATHQIEQYRSVSVYSFIIGGVIFNLKQNELPLPNLQAIVYDRSPFQERAPKIMAKRFPALGRVFGGKTFGEFATIDYPSLKDDSIPIGFLIETIPTELIVRNMSLALTWGAINFDPSLMENRCSDAIYLKLNHSEMYSQSNLYRAEILSFIESGKFSLEADRAVPPTISAETN